MTKNISTTVIAIVIISILSFSCAIIFISPWPIMGGFVAIYLLPAAIDVVNWCFKKIKGSNGREEQ